MATMSKCCYGYYCVNHRNFRSATSVQTRNDNADCGIVVGPAVTLTLIPTHNPTYIESWTAETLLTPSKIKIYEYLHV